MPLPPVLRRLALTMTLVGLTLPAAAEPVEITPHGMAQAAIGDLVLDYDDTAWQVTVRADGAALRPLACTRVFCEDGAGIAVRIAPVDGPFPTEIPASETGFASPLWDLLDRPVPWTGEGAVREINGFRIFATDRWSGCRAMSPSELTAILDHAGRRYTFTSGVIDGCRGIWDVGREAFVEILSALRPRN